MRFSKIVLLTGLALCAASSAALASHGRAGLWSMSVTMGGDRPAMPDMSQMPPEVQARMRAMGMSMGGNTITVRHCMTPDEVASDVPHVDPRSTHGCGMANVHHDGHTFSADMVCSREFNGSGHMTFTYDGDTHYTGEVVMNGVADGHPVNEDEKIDARWVSPDCGGATH